MKKEEKTELTKERILKAAIEEFGTKGYDAASLNTICSSGISKGLLYHNFENKDAVYLACIKRCFFYMKDYLLRQGNGITIQQYMDARLHFFVENPYLCRLFFESILQPPIHLNDKIKELQAEFNELNCKLFKEMLASVTLREGVTEADAMEYILLMQNMFNGYFSSSVCNFISFNEAMTAHENSLSRLLDFMLYGIAEKS